MFPRAAADVPSPDAVFLSPPFVAPTVGFKVSPSPSAEAIISSPLAAVPAFKDSPLGPFKETGINGFVGVVAFWAAWA